MSTLYSTLIEKLIALLQDGTIYVPQQLSKKEREEFVFRALENCKIVPADWYDNLIGAAQAVVSKWTTRDLARAVRNLDAAFRADCESTSEPFVFIICQGGLVQEVVGLPARTYEICDTDAFEDSPGAEAIQYFHDLTEPMKTYLRNSGWRSSLPEEAQKDS
jgi:hypothetical protein